MSANLTLALPSKGRLKEQTEAWLADCGLGLDMEGGARGYRARVAEFLERWRTDARQSGLDYALLTTDRPLDDALRGYLIRRGAGRDVTPLVGTPAGQSGSAS